MKQAGVVRQGDQTRDAPGVAPVLALQGIADGKRIVFGIHSVDGGFTRGFWQAARHQARQIDLAAVFIKADRAAVGKKIFGIKLLINGDAERLRILKLGFVHAVGGREIAVFDVIFGKALLVGGQHTVIGHQKAGDQADGGKQQKKNHQVFARFTAQFAKKAAVQRIFALLHTIHHSSSRAGTLCSF